MDYVGKIRKACERLNQTIRGAKAGSAKAESISQLEKTGVLKCTPWCDKCGP